MTKAEVCRICSERIPVGHVYCRTHAEVSVEQFCPKCKGATVKDQKLGVVRGGLGISGVPPWAVSHHNVGPIFCAVCLTPAPIPINGLLDFPHDGLEIPLWEYPFEKNLKLRELLMKIWFFSPLIAILMFIIALILSDRLLLISAILLCPFFFGWNLYYGFARDRRVEFHSKGYAGHTLLHHHKYPSIQGAPYEYRPRLRRHESLSLQISSESEPEGPSIWEHLARE